MRFTVYSTNVIRLLITLFIISCFGLWASQPGVAQSGPVAGMYRSDTYGAGWTADSLGNLEIGRYVGRVVDYRFRSDHTGTFSGLKLYFIFRTICNGCYANGNGGIIQIQVCADDGTALHMPSTTVLGSTVITDPLKQWNRLVSFPQPVPVQAGELYHIVFSNLSSDPAHNYVSIDNLYTALNGSNLQPVTADADLAVLFKSGNNPLEIDDNVVPIFSLYFDDGFRQGQGYFDVERNKVQIQNGSQVAETFVVEDADHTVSQLAVRLSPLTNFGDIKITLNNAGGQPLATGTINASIHSGSVYQWQSITFSPLILGKGSLYSIVLTAQDGAQFLVSPMERGTIYGFQTENRFTSQCQVPRGNKWSACLGMTDLDIPFYFR
jgi:hypothetical protein